VFDVERDCDLCFHMFYLYLVLVLQLCGKLRSLFSVRIAMR
jgi:hypothetical protein